MTASDDDQLTPPADLAEPVTESDYVDLVEPETPTPVEVQVAQSRESTSVERMQSYNADAQAARDSKANLARLRAELATAEAEAEPEPEPAEETGTAIALADRFDVVKAGEAWPYGTLEFKGDLLGIRLPLRQALAAFSLASSKYVSLGVKNDLTGLFIARHLSPESYGRVFSRLMDPDENDYDVDTVGELFNAIVTAAIDADKADDDKTQG